MSSEPGEAGNLPNPAHNIEDIQSELEKVTSALMSSTPAVPVATVDPNEDGPSTGTDSSSFITLMPVLNRPTVIPPPNFPVEVGELAVSPSTVRISTDEQLGPAGLGLQGEMTLRIGGSASVSGVEKQPDPPAKFIQPEETADAADLSIEDYVEQPYVEGSTEKNERYNCNHCAKTFSYKMSWINHELTHSGVKPYVCLGCDKAFPYKSSLYNHASITGRCKADKLRKKIHVSVTKIEESSHRETSRNIERPAKKQENANDKAESSSAISKKGSRFTDEVSDESRDPPDELVQKPSVESVVTEAQTPPKRKRGRPPKNPRPPSPVAASNVPSTSSAPPTFNIPSVSMGIKLHKLDEKKKVSLSPSVSQGSASVDPSRSRSRRIIQPPAWMRRMDMDYEIPLTSGIFQGDPSKQMSAGANWRAVNSITNQKRPKSASRSDSLEEVSSDEVESPENDGSEHEMQMIEHEPINEGGNSTNTVSPKAVVNGECFSPDLNPVTENDVSAPVSVIVAPGPKKRGRKKKVVVSEQPVANVEHIETAGCSQGENDNNTYQDQDGSTHKLKGILKREVVSPITRRNLRGLPHRSDVGTAPVSFDASDDSSPSSKRARLSELDDDASQQIQINVSNAIEEDTLEDEEPDSDDNEEENEGIDVVNDEFMENEEEEEEEEEEEDTDVVDGSDNEDLPSPADVSIEEVHVPEGHGGVVDINQDVAAPLVELDLKSSAISFLCKKISNRNMHRIRRELMDLTEEGDYFQLTQWAPLAAGFLQAMLLRNFSKDFQGDIP